MKKLFALFAATALAAVGCDGAKTTGKPSDRTTTGGTFVQTDRARELTTVKVTDTVVRGTVTDRDTRTVVVTTTINKGGPAIPDPKKNGKDKD